MSQTVDSKVVEMRFDNQQFEQNVQTSLKTVDDLKKSLNFDGVGKGFENIESASRAVSFSGIGNSLEEVKLKFSAFEIAAITALSNITNRAVNAGISLAKSLSIDQVTAGWSKYAQKTSSVQTIMAATNATWQTSADELSRIDSLIEQGVDKNTASRIAATYSQVADGTLSMAEAAKKLGMSKSDFESYAQGMESVAYAGTQMEFVSDELDKLNWFSDETSYSFVDMTSNIGKFTSTGQKLTDSVTAMQGISTWAALSGANTEQASRAMYNLSQALGVGAVKLMDWKSIENANMATAEFKQTALDTAVELGMLKKTTDGLYKTLDKGTEVSIKNFNASLSEGWFSTDVLMSTLNKYGEFTDKLYDASDKTGMTATQLLKATDKYKEGTLDLSKVAEQTGVSVEDLTSMFDELGSETYDLGRRAFQAAQEAKTFQEAIDATKDAVSTGWMNTFELIFGNYEEAKELWTNVANELYDIFAAGAEARNELLGGWKELGGRTAMLEAISNAWSGLKSIIDTVKEAFRDIFPPMTAERLVEITEHIRDLTARFKLSDKATENLKNTFKGLFSVLDIFLRIGKAVFSILKGVLGYILPIGGGILEVTGTIGKAITKFDEFIKESKLLEDIVTKVTTAINEFISVIKVGYVEGGGGITGVVEAIFDAFAQLVRGLFSFISKLTGIDFTNVTENIVTKIQEFRDDVVENLEKFIDFIKNFPDKFKAAFQKLTGVSLGDVFDKVKEKISDAYTKIKESIEGFKNVDTSGVDDLSNKVSNKFAPITAIFNGFKKVFEAIVKVFKKLSPVFSKLAEKFGDALGHLGGAIGSAVDNANFDNLLDLVNGGILTAIALGIKKIMDSFSDMAGNAGGILEGVTGILDGVKDSLKAWQQNLKAKTLMTIATAIGVLTASILVLSLIDAEKLDSALAAITTEFLELMFAMKSLTKTMDGKDSKGVAKAATAMISMSVAVLLLSFAMKKLAALDYDEIIKGGAAIAGLSYILVKVADSLSKNEKQVIKGTVGLIAFAIAIRLLVKPVKELGELNMEQLSKGLFGVLGLVTSLAVFFKTADLDGMSIGKGVGILLLAEAIKVLGKSVKAFGELDTTVLIKGLLAVAGVLVALGVFVKLTGDSKHVISTAAGMVILGAAMLIFSKAVENMGNMSWEQIGKGLATMAGSLVLVVAAIKLLPKSTAVIATGLVLVGAALLIIGKAVSNMGSMGWEEIGKGLVTLAGSLLIITLALKAMSGTTSGSVAMLVMAASLAILVPVLKTLGGMKLTEIGKALLALAGIFLVIGGAAALLSPVIPAILGLAAAVTLLGIGVLACAAGLLLFSTALAAFAVTGTAGIAVFVLAVESILSLIPQIVIKVGEGIVEVIKLIAKAAPELILALKDTALAALQMIEELIPKVIEILDKILAKIAEHMPSMMKSIIKILRELIGGLRDLMGDIIDLVIDTVLKILDALKKKIPDIIQAAIDLVIAFIDGLGKGLVDNAERLRESIVNLFKNLLEAVCKFLGIHSPSTKFIEIGKNIILGLIEGLGRLAWQVLSKIGEIMGDLLTKAGEKISEFIDKGKEIIGNIVSGIKSKVQDIWDAATEAIQKAISAVVAAIVTFTEKGKEIIGNIIDGIKSKMQDIWNAITGAVDHAKEAVATKVSEFIVKGKDIISNIITGIRDKFTDIWNAITGAINHAKDAVTKKVLEFVIKGKDIITNIISGIQSKFSDIKNGIKDAVEHGLGAIAELWNKMVSAGEDVINGLKKGIENAKDKVFGAVGNVASGIYNKACKVLGIKSPSRVFAEVGKYTMMGMENGIDDGLKGVLDTEEDAGNAMIDRMSKIVSDVYKEFDNDTDYQPTITPVLDLTNIKKGTSEIDGMFATDKSIQLASNANYDVNQNIKDKNDNIEAINELRNSLRGDKSGDEITNINNTFNIKSDNPKEVAEEVSRRIQKQLERKDAVWA